VLTSPDTGRRVERAFTLVELIIAMVLMAILLAVFSTVFLRSFVQSNKSNKERVAIESARQTFEQFGRDIRDARSPDRDAQYVGNASDLGGALLNDQQIVLRVPGSPTARTLDVRDVIEATTTSFTFRMDAIKSSAGSECVRYWVRPADEAFVRTVTSYDTATRTCGGAQLEEKVLMERVA
jgi:prepilin-type N-terminal cleavage/methylation domain-containing protein